MKYLPQFRTGDLVSYNHVKGYAGPDLKKDFNSFNDGGHIRDKETFLVLEADPGCIRYFNDVGVPRFGYTIEMVSCPTRPGMSGKRFKVVLDDCDSNEYYTIIARCDSKQGA